MRLFRKEPVTLDRNENLVGYSFIVPSLIGFLIFSLFPLIFTAILSFTQWDLVSGISNIKFVGLQNYQELFKDVWFIDSLKNNIIFTFIAIPLQLALGLLIAILINKYCYGKGIFKILYFLPYISSIVAISVVWMVLFHPSFGPINEFLRAIGIDDPPKWLGDTKWSLITITLMYVWQGLGYIVIVYISGLQSISPELYEAASIDGAGLIQQQKSITLPMITPTTFFLLITSIINSFKVFDQIQVMTEGGPGSSSSVLVFYMYKVAFRFYKMGYGSAIAMCLFILVFIVTFVQWQGQKKWVNYL